jgi:putative aldouronate transport system substrate-binding protein
MILECIFRKNYLEVLKMMKINIGLIWFTLVIGVFFGCSRSPNAGGASSAGPVEVHVIARSIGNAPTNDNDIFHALEKNTGLKINWELAPSSGYNEKCATVLASGNYPDMLEYWANTYPIEYQEMADDKIIAQLDDLLITNGQNILEVMPDYLWFRSNKDGKKYAIPCRNYQSKTSYALQIRRDWLDKLGLPVPIDTKSWIEVMRAFKRNSEQLVGRGNQFIPWGSFIGMFEPGIFSYICSEYGFMNNSWNERNGKLVYYVNIPEFKDALLIAREIYQDGLVDPEYMLMTREQWLEKWYANIYGGWDWYINQLDEATGTFIGTYNSNNPDAKMDIIYPFADKNGKYYMADQTGTNYAIIFEKSKVKAECVKLMDYMLSQDGSDLIEMGIKGIHWDEDSDGVAHPLMELTADIKRQMGFWNYNWFAMRSDTPRTYPLYVKAISDKLADMYTPRLLREEPGLSANIKSGTTLKQIISTYSTELISQKNINFDAKFNEMVEKWNSSGGADLTKEANEVYLARK